MPGNAVAEAHPDCRPTREASHSTAPADAASACAASVGIDPALADIDTALLSLRHLWAAPAAGQLAGAGKVELSTVWIVDALARAEAQGIGERSVGELAASLDIAHSTASRLVDRAEAAGMVRRGRSATDARQVTAALTGAGRLLAAESLAFRTTYLFHLTADWSAAERRTFARLLARFAAAAAAEPTPHSSAHRRGPTAQREGHP